MDLQFLKKVSLFKNLTREELKTLENCFNQRRFKQGDFIIRENEVSNNLFILHEGKVKITKKMTMIDSEEEEKDKTFIILDSANYGFFGEIGFLGKVQKRTATAVAKTDCEIYTITRKDFLKICEINPAIGYKVFMEIACNLSIYLEKADSDILKLTTALIFALS